MQEFENMFGTKRQVSSLITSPNSSYKHQTTDYSTSRWNLSWERSFPNYDDQNSWSNVFFYDKSNTLDSFKKSFSKLHFLFLPEIKNNPDYAWHNHSLCLII